MALCVAGWFGIFGCCGVISRVCWMSFGFDAGALVSGLDLVGFAI